MNRLLGILFLMVVSNSCFAWSLLEPKDFDECILENMKGVTSDVAARQIRKSCRSKFPYPSEKVTECTLQDFSTPEYNKLEASASITDYGYFQGNVYNGSQKTIREILITYKSKNNKWLEYKITDLNIKPLTSGDFSTAVHDNKIKKLEWNFSAKGCD